MDSGGDYGEISKGRISLHEQIAGILRGEIEAGLYAPGMPIPSEQTLIQRFGVSRDTARKAVAVLRDEGWIETRHALGSFVLPGRPRRES